MAIDDLDSFRENLPDLFLDKAPPLDELLENWSLLSIDKPDSWLASREGEHETLPPLTQKALPADLRGLSDWNRQIVEAIGNESFPGALKPLDGGSSPPPDCFAFYLPFHYFHPKWWGIYLVYEGVEQFANILRVASGSNLLSDEEWFKVSQLFLYWHEVFHHQVECFACRLEATHRRPLYRVGFDAFFSRVVDTDKCIEEALASAYAYGLLKQRAFKNPNEPTKRKVALAALEKVIKGSGPGYRRALEYRGKNEFESGRNLLAEENHPYAFSHMGRVNSRVNFLIHRDTLLAHRGALHLRYFRVNELLDFLVRVAGCAVLRDGKGSHLILRAKNGKTFPVPRHSTDIPTGTLRAILRQAGLKMSVSEYRNAGRG